MFVFFQNIVLSNLCIFDFKFLCKFMYYPWLEHEFTCLWLIICEDIFTIFWLYFCSPYDRFFIFYYSENLFIMLIIYHYWNYTNVSITTTRRLWYVVYQYVCGPVRHQYVCGQNLTDQYLEGFSIKSWKIS